MSFPTASILKCSPSSDTALSVRYPHLQPSARGPIHKNSSDSTYILFSITKRTVQHAVKDKSGLAGLSDRLQQQQTSQRSSGTVSRAQIMWALPGLLFIINAHAVMRL